jgi:hypothetical protein
MLVAQPEIRHPVRIGRGMILMQPDCSDLENAGPKSVCRCGPADSALRFDLPLEHVVTRRVLQRWMNATPERRRLPPWTRSGGEPGCPVRPPATVVLIRRLSPPGWGVRFTVIRPIAASSAWWVDNSRDVTTRCENEAGFPSNEALNAPCRVPRHDMVLLSADCIDIKPAPVPDRAGHF